MSYASGLMMGTAIIHGLRQLLGDMSAFEEMGKMSASGRGNAFGKRNARGGRNARGKSGANFDMPFGTGMGNRPEPKTVELVSSLPGRRRYRIQGMDDAQAKLLEESLGKLSYVTCVKANPVSGSLLLTYDVSMETEMDELAEALKKILQGKSTPAPLPSLLSPQTGSMTRSIHQAMLTLSKWLKQNTGGVFDARSLTSLVFFVIGVRKLLLTQQFPSGTQLIWWAVSLLRGWRNE